MVGVQRGVMFHIAWNLCGLIVKKNRVVGFVLVKMDFRVWEEI